MLEALGAACVAFAWLIPNHYPPWLSFYNESCAGLGLALIAAGTLFRKGSVRVPNATWFVAAIALIPWLQLAAGQLVFSDDAWLSSLYVLAFALAIGVGSAWMARDPVQAPCYLSWAALFASLFSSVIALNQAFQLGGFGLWSMDAFAGMRPYANLAQPNNLATLVAFGFVALFFLRESGKLSSLSVISFLVLLIPVISATQSRTALGYGPLAIVCIWFWRRHGGRFRTTPWEVLGVTACHWLVALSWPALQRWALLADQVSIGDRQLQTLRFGVWRVLLDALLTQPWAGFGWLQVGAAELSASGRHEAPIELFLQAHNILLDLAIFNGIPIALAIVVAMGYWYVSRLRAARTAAAAAGLLMISVLGLHAMLELPHYYAYFLLPIGIWVGVVDYEVRGQAAFSTRWLLVPAALASVGFVVLWAGYPRIEDEFRLARFEDLKIRTLPSSAPPVRNNPSMTSLISFLAETRRPLTAPLTDAELRSIKAISERYPYIALLKRRAESLAISGRPEEARLAFLRIGQLYGDRMARRVGREIESERLEGLPAAASLERALGIDLRR